MQPPQLLSEEELIALMDRHGIGTDATIAEHISTIQRRGYAVKLGTGRFTVTELGKALLTAYKAMNLAMSEPTLRAEVQREV